MKIQPSCFLHPSKPAFLLFPTLNFPLSLFPSHSQLKIFNFRHFTFKKFTSCQKFNIFTLISTPLPTTLPHFKEFDSKVNTLKHSAHPSLPTTFPHPQKKKNSKTLHLSLSPSSPPSQTYTQAWLSHFSYKVAPFRTQSPQNLFGTISDDSRKPLPVSCDFQTKTKQKKNISPMNYFSL